MRTILRSTISTFFYCLSLFKRREGVIVLNYHRVNDALEPNDLAVGVETFRGQMEYLARGGYEVISIAEMIEYLRGQGVKGSRGKVVITFDDGYRDNYLNAYPVLKKYNFPAVIFLATGMIGTDQKRPRYQHLPSPDMLSWDEVKEMAENKIEFGAHTVNHPRLAQISLDWAKQEIEQSRDALMQLSKTYGNAFCYPYGDYNGGVKQLVKDLGFSCAFTVKPGINKPGCDLFELTRTAMNGKDSLFDFKKKLRGAFDPLHRWVQRNHVSGDSKRINLLYIIWSLGLGGAERLLIDLAKGLDKAKYNLIICCLNEKGVFAKELEDEGIKVIALGKKGKVDFAIIGKIRAIIKEENIRIVHTHMWGANLWGRIAARLSCVPVVIATEQNVDEWKSWYHFAIDRALSRWTNKVIAVSNSVREFYISKGIRPEKIEVIYNGVNIGGSRGQGIKGSRLREEFGIKDGEKVLALIGRLVEQKGHRYFLLAFKELSRKYNIKGLIVGSGPLEQELKEFSRELGLADKVIFTGLRQDVRELLPGIDILVLPSTREGLPVVVLEAMVCGVLVAATNVGGTPEVVINGKTGIIVEPRDIVALREAIEKLITDEPLAQRLRANAGKLVEEKFSIANTVARTQELYEELLENGSRGQGVGKSREIHNKP